MSKQIDAILQDLATEALTYVEHHTHDSGRTFLAFNDEAPEWVQEMAWYAHASMMPDDWRYRLIVDVLKALAEYDEGEDPQDLLRGVDYTPLLINWFSSHRGRLEYCDRAQAEGYVSEDATMYGRLRAGHYCEQLEVFALVSGFLHDLARRSAS